MGRILIFIFLILIALGLHYADKGRIINLGKWDNIVTITVGLLAILTLILPGVSQDLRGKESTSSGPTVVVDEADSNVETLTIKWGGTGVCCNGDVIISLPKGLFDGIVVQAPPYAINAVVGSPGYPNKEFEDAHINDALILEVRHKYEVRIVGVHENGASQEIDFRITKLDN